MNENPLHESEIKVELTSPSASASKWDYCFVFPTDPKTKSFKHEGFKIVSRFAAIGFQTYLYYSIQKDEIYVLARAGLAQLQKFAAVIDYKLLLDPLEAEKRLGEGDAEAGIAPVRIPENKDATEIGPFEHIYGKYSMAPSMQGLYYRPHNTDTPFTESVRLKLSLLMLEGSANDGGADLSLRKLKKKGVLLQYFPLHDEESLKQFNRTWLNWTDMPSQMPYDDIKEYFGEKIALYFMFLGHYATWLFLPAVIGFVFQMVVVGTNDFSSPVLPFFSLFIALWSIFMLEYWKRKEKLTSMRWGMIGFEDEQMDRPEFEGEEIDSFIDGSKITYYPPSKKQENLVKSFSAIGTLATIVLAAVISIYVIRRVLYSTSVSIYAQMLASVMNSVQIAVFNIVYGKMAEHLTDMENHRTDTQYEDSTIAKLFMFQFVNSYSSFFYIAFVAKYLSKPPGAADDAVGECGYSDCMIALAINLGVIFGVRLTVSNALEVLEPLIKGIRRKNAESTGTEVALTKAEEQFMMEPYDQLKGTLNDYAELAIQFGYMTFFIAALPIATLGALINNFVEIRTDGFKLVKQLQRPYLASAEDIGTWMSVFQLMSAMCVLTNAGLISFTMTVFDDFSMGTRMWLFIIFQWFCFGSQVIIGIIIPDEPMEVQIQLKRAEFITDKLIGKVRDDNDGDLVSKSDGVSASYKIHDKPPPGM